MQATTELADLVACPRAPSCGSVPATTTGRPTSPAPPRTARRSRRARPGAHRHAPDAEGAAASCSPCYGLRAERELLPVFRRLPGGGQRRALPEGRQDRGVALGPEDARWTSVAGGRTRTASTSPASPTRSSAACSASRRTTSSWKVVERDLALNSSEDWNAGPDYPALDQVDLESVVLHELGHMAGNKKHTRAAPTRR